MCRIELSATLRIFSETVERKGMMGSVYAAFVRHVVEKVGTILLQYEADSSFGNVSDEELIFLPKCYLKYKVRSIDLESIWRKLPEFLQDEDLSKCRPCFKHYVSEGDVVGGCIPRKDCLLCTYENL